MGKNMANYMYEINTQYPFSIQDIEAYLYNNFISYKIMRSKIIIFESQEIDDKVKKLIQYIKNMYNIPTWAIKTQTELL